MRSLWHLQLLACSLACSLGLHERLEGGQSWRTFWFSWLCCEATDGRAWERGMEIRLWELHRDAWAQSNSVQCLFWHNTPTRKRVDCCSGVSSLCPKGHLAERFWGGTWNKDVLRKHTYLGDLWSTVKIIPTVPLPAGWGADEVKEVVWINR